MKSIDQIKNLKGKRVILRMDLNVPIVRGQIVDDFRIKSAIPTINLLRDAGARVVIVSHIEGKDSKTLEPVSEYFKTQKIKVLFLPQFFTASSDKALLSMKDGDVVLFENLRLNRGETENDKNFAQALASLGDVYVNEAFPVSHREHASIVGIPKFLPSYFGPVFLREVKNISMAFNPEHPFLFILGGVKFDTKMPLIQKFLKLADFIFIGGALANNFFKELNFEVGKSIVSDGNFNLMELLKTKKVFIPTDVVAVNNQIANEKLVRETTSDEMILDVGPDSLIQLAQLTKKAKFILWNGPLGNCEEGYSVGTEKLAEIISNSNAKSVVGGGDTVAAIQSLGILNKFTFVSTGGGAMLDFLANETLPGIEAVESSRSQGSI